VRTFNFCSHFGFSPSESCCPHVQCLDFNFFGTATEPTASDVQVIPEMSEHEANTNEVLFSKHNINHEEGGWPKDVDYAEAEHTIRFRKKAEKDEDYIRLVSQLGSRAEARVMQNNAIDIYQQYYTSDLTDIVAEVGTLCTIEDLHVFICRYLNVMAASHGPWAYVHIARLSQHRHAKTWPGLVYFQSIWPLLFETYCSLGTAAL
jgi:hypothetical protein